MRMPSLTTARLATLGATLGAALATAAPARAEPGTQQCLGDPRAFLTCPAGAELRGTECRVRTGEHWSGSKRQGPALFLRSGGDPAHPIVSFAAHYQDHKKRGRVFRFDKQGRLSSWSDVLDDKNHGMSVQCTEDGRAAYVAFYEGDKAVGISRSWKASDGSFSYAYQYDEKGRGSSTTVTPEQRKRPDHLCQPARCDVQATPALWTGRLP